MRGCTPRVEGGHKVMMTAQIEVASGKVARATDAIVEPIVQ